MTTPNLKYFPPPLRQAMLAAILVALVGCSYDRMGPPPVRVSSCTKTVYTPTRVFYRFTLTNRSSRPVVETEVALRPDDFHLPQTPAEMRRRQFITYISHLMIFAYRQPLAVGHSVTVEITYNPAYPGLRDPRTLPGTTKVACLVNGVKFARSLHFWGVFIASANSYGTLPPQFVEYKQWKRTP